MSEQTKATLAKELREWVASEWDGLMSRLGLEDTQREQQIEQWAQIIEAHIAALAHSEGGAARHAE